MTVLTLTFGWNAWARPALIFREMCAGLHSRNMNATAAIAVTATTAKAIAQAVPEPDGPRLEVVDTGSIFWSDSGISNRVSVNAERSNASTKSYPCCGAATGSSVRQSDCHAISAVTNEIPPQITYGSVA